MDRDATLKDALLEQSLQLTVSERAELAMELWDSIPADALMFELTVEQQAEIERRMAEHERDPSKAIPLEDFLARLRSRVG